MKKSICLIAAISLLLAGCSTTRNATSAAHDVSAETTETQRDEQTERTTSQTVTTQSDANTVVTTTVDEYDTTQPIDPVTGTPPLKRREITTSQTQARETTAAETTTAQRETVAEETRSAVQTETTLEITEQTRPARSQGWRWFKAGFFVALIIAAVVLALVYKNKIKNLLKPF